ncbi:MAG: class I SAM-dependent rRNA methyltransferase [Verrucomicrobiae bacterium]|nr:class I SAM-dependent rRNA methyltransferase [Verrucomicrobiae bacterium]
MNTASTPSLRLRVSQKAETILRGGHPWLFSDSIRDQTRPGAAGELAIIYDRKDRFLGMGLFDPDGPIRVRMLHTGKPHKLDRAWWQQHLSATLDRRRHLFDAQTNGYRLCNGESDGWPGLVLDRYDTTLVLKIYTTVWLPRLTEVVELIAEQVPHERLILRLSRNIQDKALPFTEGQILRGAAPVEPVVFLESGIRFEVDGVRGQKTGFYLDQRENRRIVESLAAGRRVLNAFSFSGGFSLYAARGGAVSVTDLDISEHALAAAHRNFALNLHHPAIGRCRHESVKADAFHWLNSTAPAPRSFDLMILDPPSLARRETERSQAIHAYGRMARRAIELLRPQGILVACSCSAHVSVPEFVESVRKAATQSARPFTELQITGHAADHPATFPEANYLKAIYLGF